MIEENDVAIVHALDRLVARYGFRSANRLVELIRDPKRAEELATVLELAATRARQSKSRSRGKKSDRVGMGILRELRTSDPEKHAVVAEFRSQLISRSILPSMYELRRFAMMNDLSIGRASSRTAAIAPLLRSIAQLPTSEILSVIDSAISASIDDRSLERWRDVIVRPRVPDSDPPETKQ